MNENSQVNEKLIKTLEKNNELLEKILKIQKSEKRYKLLQILIQILPFIILVLLGFWVFNLINANIQAVQSNVDAIKDSLAGVWDNVTFWD